MSEPRVSVIVPHYDDLDRLDRCLTALAGQTRPADEVIVADNGSPQGPEAVEAVIAGRARLVIAEARGAGPARNAGVAAATGEVLAFTDSDCVPEPGWLAGGLIALRQYDFVGGRMVVLVDDPAAKTGAEAFEQVFAFHNDRYVQRLGFTVTANLFCARDLFLRVGPFRDDMSEDVEWCERARALGYRIGYAGDAAVGHPARHDYPSLLVKWRRINAERYAMAARSLRGRAGWLLAAWLQPAIIGAHALTVMRTPLLADRRERRAALATLVRIRLWRFIDSHRLMLGR